MRALSGGSQASSLSLYPGRYQPPSEISDSTQYEDTEGREMRDVSGSSQASSLSYAEPYQFRSARRY